jgi:hypothetical protein
VIGRLLRGLVRPPGPAGRGRSWPAHVMQLGPIRRREQVPEAQQSGLAPAGDPGEPPRRCRQDRHGRAQWYSAAKPGGGEKPRSPRAITASRPP